MSIEEKLENELKITKEKLAEKDAQNAELDQKNKRLEHQIDTLESRTLSLMSCCASYVEKTNGDIYSHARVDISSLA